MGLQYKIHYKKGIHNGATDALSRKPGHDSSLYSVTTVQPIWLASVQASYVSDALAQDLLRQLALNPQSNASYTLEQGILRYKGKIWVWSVPSLQM
jgi:hypothetical protein